MDILEKLNKIILDRKLNPDEKSYTTSLLSASDNRIIKKLGEENAEFIRAFLTQDKADIISEASDYIYHLIVALRYKDIDLSDVMIELERRYNK